MQINSFIEYTNRIINAAIFCIVVATFVAAFLRRSRRVDLIKLSGLLVLGVVGDAILGAFVVYSKLNPWLVSVHMLLSLSMVAASAVLYHRSKYLYGPGERADVRDAHFRLIARLLWIPFTALLIAGTVTTGSGPHAGSSQGQLRAKRLPFALSDATWVHSVAAVLFIGIVTGLLFAIWKSAVPGALKLGVRRLVLISMVQALIGLTQFLTHLPVWLVELHVAGAVSLTIGVTQFHLRQTAHDREPGTKRTSASTVS